VNETMGVIVVAYSLIGFIVFVCVGGYCQEKTKHTDAGGRFIALVTGLLWPLTVSALAVTGLLWSIRHSRRGFAKASRALARGARDAVYVFWPRTKVRDSTGVTHELNLEYTSKHNVLPRKTCCGMWTDGDTQKDWVFHRGREKVSCLECITERK
jgi:hypothetical protein